ncbi:MAG: gliding motility-associated C-terminal domain-containing protein, partial [Bacteroidetes bacterium]
TPTEPGTLMGYVTTPDEVCNADTLNYSLEVLEVPHIVFDPARITIDSGQSVSLNPLITFSGDASLMWTDGATEVPREVSPATSTTYTLMATNPGTACSSQASVEVVIGEKPVEPIQASMPPVLTPNGDGINDVLAPLFRAGEDPKKYQLEIYNRQGALIFNQSATQPWDGGEAPDGVYYYILRNRENPVQKLKGAVLLQRTVRN